MMSKLSSIQLAPFQKEYIQITREAFKIFHAPIIHAPTGAGKTVMATSIVKLAYEKNKRVLFIVHREELIDQTAKTFSLEKIQYSFICSDCNYDPFAKIFIASIQTLSKRLNKIVRPDLIIIDECHHAIARSWKRTILSFQNVKRIGLTATPIRLDGKGLNYGGMFDKIISLVSTKWLIDNGYLSRYKLFSTHDPDLRGVSITMGDYTKSEVEKIMNNRVVVGSAIEQYLKLASGKKGIVFCCTRNASIEVTNIFKATGILAEHLDGDTPKDIRKKIIKQYRAGEIKILCNVALFGEGFDLPDIEVVIMLNPTKSLSWYLQMCGRALRNSPEKDYAVIIDHVGNYYKHGKPCDEREWTLEGCKKLSKKEEKKEEEERRLNIKRCTECYYVFPSSDGVKCPNCGHINITKTRNIQQVEGQLVEIKKLEYVDKLKAQKVAATMDDLIELGRARGYKNATGWAHHVFHARIKKSFKNKSS